MNTRAILTTLLLMTTFAHADDGLKDLVPPDAKLEKLGGDMNFLEGPVWTDADGGYLVFSDIPANKLYRWDKNGLKVFREPSNNANGNTRDAYGQLVTCEHSSRVVTRQQLFGGPNTLAHQFEGKQLNSPNDVVVKSDGTIWFTDPPYGTPKGEKRELDKQHVFRLTAIPASRGGGGGLRYNIASVVDDFDRPNGLCFSPDEKTLYIADSGKAHHIRAFDVQPDNTLANGRVFCVIDKGIPDGIRCDETGHVWSSAGDGVHVFAPDGKLLGKIAVPETPANLCFGGEDGKTLFITAQKSLYAIRTNVRGATRPNTK
jgi:gluconolactonase